MPSGGIVKVTSEVGIGSGVRQRHVHHRCLIHLVNKLESRGEERYSLFLSPDLVLQEHDPAVSLPLVRAKLHLETLDLSFQRSVEAVAESSGRVREVRAFLGGCGDHLLRSAAETCP